MKEKDILLRFGEKVRLVRSRNKISQEKLAELSSLDRTYISSVERGKRNISILNIFKIANALSINPSSLLEDLGVENGKY